MYLIFLAGRSRNDLPLHLQYRLIRQRLQLGKQLNLQHTHGQSEHIGQWATPHHLSDVRRGAPSWIWDYLAYSDVTIYVLNAIHAILCAIAG